MESRFAHHRERDTSVSMLRVKMSRRRSLSQKENRTQAVNQRRQLDQISEQDISCLDANVTYQEKINKDAKSSKNNAVEERAKQLERWRERKALEKEKEKREKERKGVFKTGVYHRRDAPIIISVPSVPATLITTKETRLNVAPQGGRVTRSMKQQQVQKLQNPNTAGNKGKPEVEKSTRTRTTVAQTKNKAAAEPVRALSTRSVNKPATVATTAVKNKPTNKPTDVRTTRSRAAVGSVMPACGRATTKDKKVDIHPAQSDENDSKRVEEPLCPSASKCCSDEDDMVVDVTSAAPEPAQDPSSFAPQGFVFQAPTGLSSFKFEPMSPRSADAFLTTSPSFNFPIETKHDVTYFRAELSNETERLTTLSNHWETKVEDESIPIELRDQMRAAVGQARLLIKGQFNQFSSLVDDCELQCGANVTTLTDLQGFWDMVYNQIGDVNKRFEALREAEVQGWEEEHKPSTRPRDIQEKDTEDVEEHPCPPTSECCPDECNMLVDDATVAAESAKNPSSFAPDGLELERLSTPLAEAFQTPSHAIPPPPPLDAEPQGESIVNSKESSTIVPAPGSPLESKHDVPYFRSEISNETERLTSLSAQWEPKVEDESIPEEMRDRMRTAVGQARLLMKERFNQFSGLVDDCELQRGDKITTCTDLQGFWDMVYYQVEDVYKKFEALKEAEARGWVEEHKPPPRQRKVVKKPAAGPSKAAGTKAAARSRLAAVKAAMKAKQLAEKVTGSSGNAEEEPTMSCEEAQPAGSPAKASGSVRKSSRLSAAAQPQDSPCSNYLTPRRVTRRSLALMQTQESPAQSFLSPSQPRLVLNKTPSRAAKSQCGTPQRTASKSVNMSPSVSPAPSESFEKQAELLQENAALLPEVDTDVSIRVTPSISVVEEESEAAITDFCLSTCVSTPSEHTAMVTPAATTTTVVRCSPAVQGSTQSENSVCQTPDGSLVEDAPGLDFELYLLPSSRGSLSPKVTASCLNHDVEMESPRCLSEGVSQQEAAPERPVLPLLPLQLPLPQVQSAENSLLLFTPNLNDRIRESVCPSDLMVFTPPH